MCMLFHMGKNICSFLFGKGRWGAWQAVVSVHTSRLILNLMQVFLPTHPVSPLLSMSIRKPLAASLAKEHETVPCLKSWTLLQPRAPALWANTVHITDPLGPPWPGLQDPSPAASRSVCRCLVLVFSIPRHHSSAESLRFTPRSARGRSGSPSPPDISYQPWKVTADRGSSRLMSQPQLQHMAGRVWPSFNPAKYAKKENESVGGSGDRGFFYFLDTFLLLYLCALSLTFILHWNNSTARCFHGCTKRGKTQWHTKAELFFWREGFFFFFLYKIMGNVEFLKG